MVFESEDLIRVRAYQLWEENGRPEGRDLEFWEQARQSVPQDLAAGKKSRNSQSSADLAAAKAAKRSKRKAKKHSD